MKLRPHQEECKDAVMQNAALGRNQNLCVEPTGAGKSVIMAAISKSILDRFPGKKILFISHRKELDQQNAEAFLTLNPEKTVGFEKAESICPESADAMFASILSVGKEGIPRIRRWTDPKNIAAVFIDEAHHLAGGKTYQTLLREIQAANPNVLVVGLTATPERADGEKISEYLPYVAHETEIEELIESGYLAGLRGVSVQTESDLLGTKSHRGDFTEADLAARVDNDNRNALAARLFKENHAGEKGMAFAVNKAHAASLAKAFELQGIKTACITEDTPKEERDSLKKRLRSGEIDMVANVNCLTEGFDFPEIKCIFALRPTKSPTLLAQMLGRGMRLITEPIPEKPGEYRIRLDLKATCTVYDFVDLHSKEAGAKRAVELLGVSKELDIELKGENLSVLENLTKLVSLNPLAAANLAQAKSKEEIQQLLLPIDILARIKAQKPRKGTNLPWTPGPEESHYLALCKGELCRLSRDPRGIFILHHPELKIQEREDRLARFQKKTPSTKANTPRRSIELGANNLAEAFAEATIHLKPALQYDLNVLASDAPWKKKSGTDQATEKQRAALAKRGILSQKELGRICKKDASTLLTLCEVKENTLRAIGKMPAGRFEGIDLGELALRKPAYLQKCLDKGLAKSWGNEEATRTALQAAPFPWLEKNRKGTFKTKIKPDLARFENEWQTNPNACREEIVKLLEADPTRDWELIETLAKERAAIFASRNPNRQKYRQTPPEIPAGA